MWQGNTSRWISYLIMRGIKDKTYKTVFQLARIGDILLQVTVYHGKTTNGILFLKDQKSADQVTWKLSLCVVIDIRSIYLLPCQLWVKNQSNLISFPTTPHCDAAAAATADDDNDNDNDNNNKKLSFKWKSISGQWLHL